MTNEEASTIVGNMPINGDECYSIPEYQQAKAMAIQALELIGLLKDRPCEACIFNKGTCAKWSCPFDKAIDTEESE